MNEKKWDDGEWAGCLGGGKVGVGVYKSIGIMLRCSVGRHRASTQASGTKSDLVY